jgi:hypothetical protein
MSSTAWPQAM